MGRRGRAAKEPDPETLGGYITITRLAKGWRQKDVAAKLRVSTGYLSKVENNLEWLSDERLEQIVVMLDLDRDQVKALRKDLDVELLDILFANYDEVGGFLRSLKGLPPEKVARILQAALKFLAEYPQNLQSDLQ